MPRELSISDPIELAEEHGSLSDRLKAFKTSKFDSDGYIVSKCQTMSEKEIKQMYHHLVDLKKASGDEMRKSVYANYGAFIRTSREITDLEGQLLSMRNLLSNQSALVHGLAERVQVDSLWADSADSLADDVSSLEEGELAKSEDWLIEFLDNLEVLLSERRVEETMSALEKGERLVNQGTEHGLFSMNAVTVLQNNIGEQRQKLADQLADTIKRPSTGGAELRSSVLALKRIGDGPRAHTLLLNSHYQKLRSNMQNLHSATTSYGGAYTAALAQLVFSSIAQAVTDSLAVFGEEPAYMSELVTWTVKQTDKFALLLKRHVLAPSAAAGGLRVAAECVQVCSGHCSLLEAKGLALSPVLLRHFSGCIWKALNTNLKRIEQSSMAAAAEDDWSLNYSPLGSSTTSQPKLSSSANRFNTLVQEFFEDVGPLGSLQLDGPALEGILQVFNEYVNLLIQALPGSAENEENLEGSGTKLVRMAETEIQQIALLANASLLSDELLPRAAMKIMPPPRPDLPPRQVLERQSRAPEQREWKRKLGRAVDRLRDSFCRLHALEVLFTEEGDIRLNSRIYTSMDDSSHEPEWFPSPIFQELFLKLTRIASIATDMFVGRERFATVLLMRLTETVILWLSDEQTFWEEIEQGQKPLGPLGLQQFYLDMEFVLLFASQGRYMSRNLHLVIKTIIARAIQAVAASVDPYSVLPEDDWFAEVAQIAIKMLTGKANFGNVEQENASPTSSSVISHGSN